MPNWGNVGIAASAIAGAGITARIAWNRSARNKNMDTEDRAAYSTMWGLTGTGIGLGAYGMATNPGAATRGLQMLGIAAKGTYKAATWNPLRSLANTAVGKRIGIGQGFRNFTGARGGVMAGLAILAGGVGAMAYGARKNPQTTAYASRDQRGGGTTYESPSSVKERMGMLGAAGDMVFGLNNARHG